MDICISLDKIINIPYFIETAKNFVVFSVFLHCMKPFLFSILLSFTVIHSLKAVPSPQQAWTDGFWQQLPEEEELAINSTTTKINKQSVKLPPGALLPCPSQYFFHLDRTSWAVSLLILLTMATYAAFQFYRWHQQPRRWRQRRARNELREWLRSNSNELPQKYFFTFLREAFDRPDCTNLLQLADSLEKKHPDFATALRQIEHDRFSSATISSKTLSEFRKHLGKLLTITLLLCLTSCYNLFQQQWRDAVQLANNGYLQESLDIFLELSHQQSSWQLSRNIAFLYSHLDSPQEAAAWNTHSQIQMAAYGHGKPWYLHYAPEILLPLTLACLCLVCSCHYRHLFCLTLSFICFVSFITTVQPRFRLAHQVIVSAPSALLPIPDTTASPAVHLMELPVGTVMSIAGKTTISNCIQVEYNHTHGWFPKQNVLFFMPQ